MLLIYSSFKSRLIEGEVYNFGEKVKTFEGETFNG